MANLFAGSGGAELGDFDHFEGYFLDILGGGEKTLSFETDETLEPTRLIELSQAQSAQVLGFLT